jgi:lauroyl/myristoyl acyltransferase
MSSFIWTETWLRYPLATLKMLDRIEETFDQLDPDGTRFGLSKKVVNRHNDHLLYKDVPDLFTLFTRLEDKRFRRRALRYEALDVLMREVDEGPGAIVAGFRVGVFPALPWALATLGRDVTMMVGHPKFVELGTGSGGTLLPRLTKRIEFANARDPRVLALCARALDGGGIASTLVEMSGLEYEKTTKVRFLDQEIDAPYGLSYLSAVTRRSIVPAVLTRADGPVFSLRFGEPLPPPERNREAVKAGAQDVYDALEGFVRHFPDQWAGWTELTRETGVDAGPGESPVRPVLA